MYYKIIDQCAKSLKTIETWLSEAEQYAAAKKFNIDVLMNGRLAPDMGPFIYQVQSACDYVKGGAAWLSGQKPPRLEDNEHTVDELRARIQKTLVFVATVREEQYVNAASHHVTMSWAPKGKTLLGEDYLLQMVIPNVYFHMAMAYAILRHNGVDVGKKDFLGSINWVNL
jgi:uncharacterized protein